jgi:hypothetical protein
MIWIVLLGYSAALAEKAQSPIAITTANRPTTNGLAIFGSTAV